MNSKLDLSVVPQEPEEIVKSRFDQQYLTMLADHIAESQGVFTKTNGRKLIEEELYGTENDFEKQRVNPWLWENTPVPYKHEKDPVRPYFLPHEKLAMVQDPMDVISTRDFGALEYSDANELLKKYVDNTEDWSELINKKVSEYDMNHLVNLASSQDDDLDEEPDEMDEEYEEARGLHGDAYRKQNYGTLQQQRDLVLRAGRIAVISNKDVD